MNRRIVFPLLSGTLLFLSFPPVSWGFLAWAALVPFFWAVHEASDVREAAHAGAMMGLFFYPASLWWMVKIFGPFAPAFWCIFALWAAAAAALAKALWGKLGRRPWLWALAAATSWTGIEYFRSEVWGLNNAWLALGYSQGEFLPFFQFCRWGGIYGLSWMIVLVNAAVFLGMTGVRRGFAAAGILLALLGIGGSFQMRAMKDAGPPLSVAAVQDESADIVRLAGMSREKAGAADVVLWPEYSVWVQPGQEKAYQQLIHRQLGARRGISLIGGFTHGEGPPQNFTWAMAADGSLLGRYDKLHPIPFVEKGLAPNPDPRPIPAPFGKIGVQICYDFDFENGSRRMARLGAGFLAVPNIDPEKWGWWQHRQHSAMAPARAVETGRWVVRAASSGESQIIDPVGRVKSSLPFAASGVLTGTLFQRGEITPYVSWGWLAGPLCLAGVSLFVLWVLPFRRRR